MICFIALIVFAVMGIFSARHRELALEAFDCVFRKVTLRKCQTGLDARIRTQVTALFHKFSPPVGRFVYRNFQIFSWAFTILFVWSLVAVAMGGYNYWAYGNCNGPNESGFCIFDPTGEHTGTSSLENDEACKDPVLLNAQLGLENVDKDYFLKLTQGEHEVLFFGCYACPFTRDAYPTIKKLAEENNVAFTFAHFPVKGNTTHLSPVVNCLYQQMPSKVMDFNDALFSADVEQLSDWGFIYSVLDNLGANRTRMNQCIQSDAMSTFTDLQQTEIEETGIFGTPLVFVNEEPVVGPKPLRVYTRLLTK